MTATPMSALNPPAAIAAAPGGGSRCRAKTSSGMKASQAAAKTTSAAEPTASISGCFLPRAATTPSWRTLKLSGRSTARPVVLNSVIAP